MKAKITRQEDDLVKEGELKYVEFNEYGRGKALHDVPKVGYALILDPQYAFSYTWMTSVITEVISETEIKTKNSTYKIELL